MKYSALILLFALGLSAQVSSRFTPATNCQSCHSSLALPAQAVNTAEVGVPHRMRSGAKPEPGSIAPFPLWQGSMMANAAIDPYWRAKVRYEVAATPAARATIEDKCMSCHTPMQQYDTRIAGGKAEFDHINALGSEGVSCTVCHQISAANLGTKDSFTARFLINDNRQIYGPHPNPFANPMVASSGYSPVQAAHVLESSLCATCHTVITPTLGADGSVLGEFLEQAPYLEWLVSDFPANGRTCQSCHMPKLKDTSGRDASQYIAHRPNSPAPFPSTAPRAPFGQHTFAGANVQVLGMLAEMDPANKQLTASAHRTMESLRDAVNLKVTGRAEGGELALSVDVTNRTGHKLPTAYPSRRMWLHVLVTDNTGAKVFESGRLDARTGEIVGLSAGVQPHWAKITRPDQVMIYEAELKDSQGNHTLSLLRAAGYLKDNRILPRGFDPMKPLPAGISASLFAPAGVEGDESFRPGSDRVEYAIPAPPSGAPFKVSVEVYFQNVKPSHLDGMDRHRSTEESAFLDLYTRHKGGVVIARQEALITR